MIEFVWDEKGIWTDEPASFEKLHRNFFGTKREKGSIFLKPEEALYLMNFQNAVCRDSSGRQVSFNELASFYATKEPRFLIKYNAYRDWRDRGLVIKRMDEVEFTPKGAKKNWKRYPAKKMGNLEIKSEAFWYPESLYAVMEDEAEGRMLFNNGWFGQLGVYKQDRGSLLKLDFMETVFLSKHFGLKVINSATGKKINHKTILQQVAKKREYTKQLYEVYEDWRMRAYVVKTGFKFGAHFRIYFPGASPAKEEKEWIHSKHVLHVFPKEQKMLISEWSRAVRVAHGVKKTFILCIPEMKKEDYVDYPADFLAYRRKKEKEGWVRETPDDSPRYLLVPVAEDEHIGGVELASLLKKAMDMGLELLLSITDRETSITYYVLKRIMLPESRYECYEIEWMRP